MIRIRITSPDENVSGSAYINLVDPQIIEGYWWSNEKQTRIKYAYLGQTVTFRIKTEDMYGELLCLRLYDTEQKKFLGDKSWTRVSDNETEVELELKEIWWFELIRFGGRLELYYEVGVDKYPQIGKKLPENRKDYLTIMPRLLYVASQYENGNLPFIYSRSGEAFSIKEAILDPVVSTLDDPISTAKDIVYDYYITKLDGSKVGKLALKGVNGVFNYGGTVKDLADVVRSEGKSVSSMTLPLSGTLAPLAVAADLVVSDFCKQLDEKQELADRIVFQQKKQKGYNVIRKYLSDEDPLEDKYTLVDITPSIAVDIVKGKYNSLVDIDENIRMMDEGVEKDVVLLCRYIKLKDNIKIAIIEAFYTRNL